MPVAGHHAVVERVLGEEWGGEQWYEANVRQQFSAAVREQVQALKSFEVKSKVVEISERVMKDMHEKYKDKDFVILGFPANDFLHQEPGTNEEIKSFCTLNYGVSFDMFAKISVKGKEIAPLYAFLTSRETNAEFGGSIKWNFTKFLLNRDGKIVARFGARAKPDSDEVIQAIQAALDE